MAGRALDAVLLSARDAYLLPGICLVVVQQDRPIQQFFVGQQSVAAADALRAVDGETLFAVRAPAAFGRGDCRAIKAGEQSVQQPHSQRARGHRVDLARASVQPLLATTADAAATQVWLRAADAAPVLRAALKECPGASRCAQLAGPWQPAPADGQGLACSHGQGLAAPGFAVHLEVDCDQQTGFALWVNAEGAPGFAAALGQVRATVRAYLPKPLPRPQGAYPPNGPERL